MTKSELISRFNSLINILESKKDGQMITTYNGNTVYEDRDISYYVIYDKEDDESPEKRAGSIDIAFAIDIIKMYISDIETNYDSESWKKDIIPYFMENANTFYDTFVKNIGRK